MYLEILRPYRLGLLLLAGVLFLSYYRSLLDFSPVRKITSLVVRILLVLALVLALCEPVLLTPSYEKELVLLLDRSASIDESARKTSDDYANRIRHNFPDNRVHLLEFAKDAKVASDHDSTGPEKSWSEDTWSNETNLTAALRYGLAMVPADRVPELVLFSDGNETRENVLEFAASLPPVARVSAVPLQSSSLPEVRIDQLRLPRHPRFGEPFHIEVQLDGNITGPASLALYRDNFQIAKESLLLTPGKNSYLFRNQVMDQKSHVFTAVVESSGDTLAENNKLSDFVYGQGRPHILLIDGSEHRPNEFMAAVSGQEMDIQYRPPFGLPSDLKTLESFDAVLFSDVRADQLSLRQMETLRDFVRLAGGGFLMFGGENSFGLGGYYKTPIEDILPVACDFNDNREKSSLAIAFVMDRSGSMQGEKIELAKRSVLDSIELLSQRDFVSVLAFDSEVHSVVPIQNIASSGTISSSVTSINAEGGTNIYPALTEAAKELASVNARVKHVILLSDGYSVPGDFDAAVRNMTQNKITLSTIGIGDADQELLAHLAQLGQGRHYACSDVQSIPRIFARETTRAAGNALRELPFQPVVITPSETLANIDIDSSPLLLGYNVTRPKPTSQIILANETGDPLLAWWRYGLGMSAAFTSDVKSRWSAEWLSWPEFAPFWSQTLRRLLRSVSAQQGQVTIQKVNNQAVNNQDNNQWEITVEPAELPNGFLHNATIKTEVTAPDDTRTVLSLTETIPGRYSARIVCPQRGIWMFRTTLNTAPPDTISPDTISPDTISPDTNETTSSEKTVLLPTTAISIGYPEEFLMKPTDQERLSRLTAMTGGLLNPDIDSLTQPDPNRAVLRSYPLWPWFVLAAIFLYLFDLFLRRFDSRQIPFFGKQSAKSGRSPS